MSLIGIINPDFIVVLSMSENDSLVRKLRPLASEIQCHILVLESVNTVAPEMSINASDLRSLGIMSYFHRTGIGTWEFTSIPQSEGAAAN